MRVSLIFPPQWTAAQPHLGMATLNGELRRAGHEVRLHDLNLAVVEQILSSSSVALSLRRALSAAQLLPLELALRQNTELGGVDGAAEKLGVIERWLAAGSEHVWELSAQAEGAREDLRRAATYYSPASYVAAHGVLDRAIDLYSLPYYPSRLLWNGLLHPHVPLNPEAVIAFAQSSTDNPFRALFEPWLPGIIEGNPPAGAVASGLVGISISAYSQVLPGLTLAMMLREAWGERPGRPHLSIGGNFFSRLRDALLSSPAFFTHFADSVVIGEGERPFSALATALEGAGGDLSGVPCLLYRAPDSGEIRETPEARNYPMNQLAPQSLEGLPLDRYLSPERVICIRASKGCYYGACAFCDSYHGLQTDRMNIQRLIAEMRQLQEAHGIRHFEFVDQCIAPGYVSRMCDAILEAGLDVRWFMNARTEPGFTPELLGKMKRAGATMVMWGIESGSARLLKLMKKGVSPSGRLQILKDASDAGLFNFAYVFFGFPTETEAEAMSTIDLIRDHTDIIHAYGRSVFSLGRHSPLMHDPEAYGVLRVVEDDQSWATEISYEATAGLQGEALSEMVARCARLCREAYGDPLWMALRSREALHLYLARHGRDYVQRFQFPRANQAAASPPEFIF